MSVYVKFFVIEFKIVSVTFKAVNNLCEPAIQVKRENFLPQIWNIEKFESKLNHMKDIHQQWQLSENKVRRFSYRKKEVEVYILI